MGNKTFDDWDKEKAELEGLLLKKDMYSVRSDTRDRYTQKLLLEGEWNNKLKRAVKWLCLEHGFNVLIKNTDGKRLMTVVPEKITFPYGDQSYKPNKKPVGERLDCLEVSSGQQVNPKKRLPIFLEEEYQSKVEDGIDVRIYAMN